jgi:hypothetical protein
VQESHHLQSDALIGTTSLKTQIAQTDKEIAALLNAIKAGMLQPSMKAEFDQLERNKAELAEQYNTSVLDQSSAPVEIERLLFEKLNDLPQALNHPEIIHVAGEIIRSLIDTIVSHPHPLRGHMEVRISGPIAATLQYVEYDNDNSKKA